MASSLDALRQPFLDRVRAPRAWSWFAVVAPRGVVTLLLVLAPALAYVLVALAWEPAGRVLTRPDAVNGVFVRYISAVVTAGTIAVGFGTLALGRAIKGVGEIRRHTQADADFVERVRRRGDGRLVPSAVGPFVHRALLDVAGGARLARDAAARAGALELRVREVRIEEYLEEVARSAEAVAANVLRERERPSEMMAAALDFNDEGATMLLRAFRLDPRCPREVLDALDELDARLGDAGVAVNYLKTLVTQWDLSQLSRVIILSAFAAVVAATAGALGYGDETHAALGVRGSALVVGVVLAFALLPVAAFVSHALRLVFRNEHTLPIGEFVLGPEDEPFTEAAAAETRRG